MISLAFLCGCESLNGPENETPVPGTPVTLTKAGKEIAAKANDFGLRLMDDFLANGDYDDYCISPLSLILDMSMCASGAVGETARQMYDVMGFGEMNREDVDEYCRALSHDLAAVDKSTVFESANSLWFKKIDDFKVKESYISNAKKYYAAEVYTVPFDKSTESEINTWAEKKTHDKIHDLVQYPFSPDLRAMLINAIYFNGKWAFEFNEKKETGPFHSVGGDVEATYLLSRKEFGYASLKTCQIADFPYGNDSYSLTVVLPNEGYRMNAVLDDLMSERGVDALANVHKRKREVDVKLPEFRIECKTNFVEPLERMGMVAPFDDLAADFSGISDLPLVISDIFQKTYIDVNEKGTEAAAATVISMEKATSIGPDEIPLFHVNRPFFFILRENSSETYLFVGLKK